MMRPDDERRSRGGAAPNVVSRDTANPTPNRCRACGSRISAPESLRTGYGQDCRRRLRAMLTTGAAVRETARQTPAKVVSTPSPAPLDPEAVRAAAVALRAAADALDALAGGAR